MSDDSRPIRHEVRVTVRDADIDALGHVNNVVYVQWVQDAAASHWRHVASDEALDAVAWVAIRHEIDYKSPALPRDEIVARTWVERWTAVTSERHTEIARASDGTLLAKAVTTWCAVDPETRRPKRVAAEVRREFHRA